MGNFYPLEVLARGSETQLQMGENLYYLIYRFKGYFESPPPPHFPVYSAERDLWPSNSIM